MRREYLLFLAACVFSAAVFCHQVRAEENTEFDPTENTEEPADGDVPDNPLETGALMVENPCDEGDLEIICSTGIFVAEWDCSDTTAPVGEACIVRVTPHEGYAVGSVLFNGESLEPGEDGLYSLTLESGMSDLVISYVISAVSTGPGEEKEDDEGEDPREEDPDGEQTAEPTGNSGRKFASDISYDVTVLHRDENGDFAADAMISDESSPTGPDLAGEFAANAAFDSEIPASESVDVFESKWADSEDISEPAEESEENFPETSGPAEAFEEEPENAEIAMAGLPEELSDSVFARPERPAAADMTVIRDPQKSDVPVWDGKLIGILVAGAVLSMLSAYAVRRY